jgi:cysteine desulfurase
MKQQVYLDYAAATPMDSAIVRAIQTYFSDQFYNPSAQYLAAKKVRAVLDAARARTAGALGARSGEIIFTAGATEANNLAIHGVMRRFPKGKVLISAIEHESVRRPASLYSHAEIPVHKNGQLNLEKLRKALDDEVVLVSVVYANNEIGSIQPLAQISELIKTTVADRQTRGVTRPLYLHTDAAQAPNYCHIQAKRLGVDLMSLNGGKIYGPKQSGCLFVRAGVTIEPQITGGGQEHGQRSGTENVAGIVGFSLALEAAVARRAEAAEHMRDLRDYVCQQIAQQLPAAVINSPKDGLHNIVHLTFEGYDNERLMMELDERGIMVATGSACSASSEEASHVLTAVGLSEEAARSSIRLSMGRDTSKQAIDYTVKTLVQILSK